jgi:hypothetical protein
MKPKLDVNRPKQKATKLLAIDGEVMWTMSFAFCGFVFLHVMGDGSVIVNFGFDCSSR